MTPSRLTSLRTARASAAWSGLHRAIPAASVCDASETIVASPPCHPSPPPISTSNLSDRSAFGGICHPAMTDWDMYRLCRAILFTVVDRLRLRIVQRPPDAFVRMLPRERDARVVRVAHETRRGGAAPGTPTDRSAKTPRISVFFRSPTSLRLWRQRHAAVASPPPANSKNGLQPAELAYQAQSRPDLSTGASWNEMRGRSPASRFNRAPLDPLWFTRESHDPLFA
jgi:hypothetical protein